MTGADGRTDRQRRPWNKRARALRIYLFRIARQSSAAIFLIYSAGTARPSDGFIRRSFSGDAALAGPSGVSLINGDEWEMRTFDWIEVREMPPIQMVDTFEFPKRMYRSSQIVTSEPPLPLDLHTNRPPISLDQIREAAIFTEKLQNGGRSKTNIMSS